MKPLVLILSGSEADRRAITQAATSHGCRTVAFSGAAETLAFLDGETPSLIFCDAVLASGGGVLKSAAVACGRSRVSLILLVPPDIKPGLLKALKPRVHDYLTTPVLREAAAVRIKNALREKHLEGAVEGAVCALQGWLSRMESVITHFEPLSFDASKAQDELARRVVRMKPDDKNRPAHLMIAVPDGQMGLDCDLYAAEASGPQKIGSCVKVPESTIFLSLRSENGLTHFNHFGRGARLAEFQSNFPPELLKLTGPIQNLAGTAHAGVYVVAFNYGRTVTEDDALYLRGLALPGSFLGAVAENVRDVSESFLVMARALALATDSQGDNGAHVSRMNEYAKSLAEQMSLPERFVQTISYSAQLHDVGKIYIHPDLLEKPLRLTPHEFDLVKKHPILGAKILGDSPMLHVAKNIALTHHECWDGSGYPAGLSGKAIPLEGAIVKVADVYDALRTIHAYKSPLSHDDACRFILEGGGDERHEVRPSHFHPEVLTAFEKAATKFGEIYHAAGA